MKYIVAHNSKIQTAEPGDVIECHGRLFIEGPLSDDVTINADYVEVDGIIGKHSKVDAAKVNINEDAIIGEGATWEVDYTSVSGEILAGAKIFGDVKINKGAKVGEGVSSCSGKQFYNSPYNFFNSIDSKDVPTHPPRVFTINIDIPTQSEMGYSK